MWTESNTELEHCTVKEGLCGRKATLNLNTARLGKVSVEIVILNLNAALLRKVCVDGKQH